MNEGRPESSVGDWTFRPAPTRAEPADGQLLAGGFSDDKSFGASVVGSPRHSPEVTGSRHHVTGPGHREVPLGPAIVHASVPFTGPVGPLIGFLVLREKPGPDRDSVVEALNFSLCYTGAVIVSAILTTVLIGAVMLPLVMLATLVLGIAGAIDTYRGLHYRYPVNLRLVR